VIDWLLALAKIVPANPLVPDAGGVIRHYAEMILVGERYDSRDFNNQSREFVARQCKFWPGYADLCDALDRWPKPAAGPLRKPPESAIPETRTPPTEEEKAAVHELVLQIARNMREASIERQRLANQAHRGLDIAPKPPKDVTMKGDALRASRLARGCSVPVP
jgi:hypothetical protein